MYKRQEAPVNSEYSILKSRKYLKCTAILPENKLRLSTALTFNILFHSYEIEIPGTLNTTFIYLNIHAYLRVNICG